MIEQMEYSQTIITRITQCVHCRQRKMPKNDQKTIPTYKNNDNNMTRTSNTLKKQGANNDD